MKLAPAQRLLFTPLGAPLAFDLIDADNPSQPAQIIGRATYVKWYTNDVILYSVRVQLPGSDQVLLGELPIKHPCSRVKHGE